MFDTGYMPHKELDTCKVGAAVVQWNPLHFGGLGILEHTGSNPGHSVSGDCESTWGSGSQMCGLSDRRTPLGGLL